MNHRIWSNSFAMCCFLFVLVFHYSRSWLHVLHSWFISTELIVWFPSSPAIKSSEGITDSHCPLIPWQANTMPVPLAYNLSGNLVPGMLLILPAGFAFRSSAAPVRKNAAMYWHNDYSILLVSLLYQMYRVYKKHIALVIPFVYNSCGDYFVRWNHCCGSVVQWPLLLDKRDRAFTASVSFVFVSG